MATRAPSIFITLITSVQPTHGKQRNKFRKFILRPFTSVVYRERERQGEGVIEHASDLKSNDLKF